MPAFILAGLPVHNALGTNKLASAMGTAVSTIRYAISGYMVRSFVVAGVACGLAGSALGSNLALLASAQFLKAVMLAALPFIAFFILRTRDLDVFADDALSPRKGIAITALIALVVGIYDGFYGPGTGTFLLLLLTAVGHQDIRTAAGTTKAINLSTNLAALTVFLVNGVVLLPLGIAAGLFNIAGNFLGSRKFTREGSRIARPVMLVVLVLFAGKLISDLALGL